MLIPHGPLFIMLIESWVDEIAICPVTLQGGLIPTGQTSANSL